MNRHTLRSLQAMKGAGEKIAALTCYDASFARVLDGAGVDVALVGDSLGMVVQGRDSTLAVTLEDMAYHTACVARGLTRALLVADLPFASYQVSPRQAYRSAARLMAAGAHMVKLEGGAVMADTVAFLVQRGIPVCAHLGLLPQSVHQLGGYRVQGCDEAGARQLLEDARMLQEAGAGLIVLEAMPAVLAAEISRALTIPTLGIGAGPGCDGQVLVLYDALGLYAQPPRFAKNFLAQGGDLHVAVAEYVRQVKAGEFPDASHTLA